MENYTRQSRLGEGGFGIVYLVRDRRDGQLYVMKEVDMAKLDAKAKADALKEAQFLRHLRHPNIVGYHDYFESKTIQPTRFGHATVCKLHIVMDYADGGDLESRIKAQQGRPFPESQVIAWLVQMALALKHVHDRKILHRDIKAQNVFLTKQGIVKLGDFGIAKSLAHTFAQARTMIGTPYYLSPEICREAPYDSKSDMWALGVVLYELMCLTHPFKGNSMQDLLKRICTAQPPPLPPAFSAPLRALCSRLLSKDPAQRPSINQLLGLPWIRAHIASFLDQQLLKAEFSHTVIHTHTRANSPERVAVAADQPLTPWPAPVQGAQAAAGDEAHLCVGLRAHARAPVPAVARAARARALGRGMGIGPRDGARAESVLTPAARDAKVCAPPRVGGMMSEAPGSRHQRARGVVAAADAQAQCKPACVPDHGRARGGAGAGAGVGARGVRVSPRVAGPNVAGSGAGACVSGADAADEQRDARRRVRASARDAWRSQLAEARRRGVASRPPWVDVLEVNACAPVVSPSQSSQSSPPDSDPAPRAPHTHTRDGSAGAYPEAAAEAPVWVRRQARGGAGGCAAEVDVEVEQRGAQPRHPHAPQPTPALAAIEPLHSHAQSSQGSTSASGGARVIVGAAGAQFRAEGARVEGPREDADAFDPFKGGQAPAGMRAQAEASYEQQLARARREYQLDCLNARRRQQGLPPVTAADAAQLGHSAPPQHSAPARVRVCAGSQSATSSPCPPAPDYLGPVAALPPRVADAATQATCDTREAADGGAAAACPRMPPTTAGNYEAELARVRAAYAEERRRARARALAIATEAESGTCAPVPEAERVMECVRDAAIAPARPPAALHARAQAAPCAPAHTHAQSMAPTASRTHAPAGAHSPAPSTGDSSDRDDSTDSAGMAGMAERAAHAAHATYELRLAAARRAYAAERRLLHARAQAYIRDAEAAAAADSNAHTHVPASTTPAEVTPAVEPSLRTPGTRPGRALRADTSDASEADMAVDPPTTAVEAMEEPADGSERGAGACAMRMGDVGRVERPRCQCECVGACECSHQADTLSRVRSMLAGHVQASSGGAGSADSHTVAPAVPAECALLDGDYSGYAGLATRGVPYRLRYE